MLYNEQCSNEKYKRKENTKQEQSKHGPLEPLEVGSGAMEKYETNIYPL